MIENLIHLAYRPAMNHQVDILSQILERLCLQGNVYCRSSLGRPWQLQFEAHDCMVFHAVEHGKALLELEGNTLLLEKGDFVLLPHGQAHRISHPKQTLGARVPRIQMGQVNPCRNEIWTNAKPETILLCGTLYLAYSQQHLLLPNLPEILHVPRQTWLDALLYPMALEASAARLGASTILKRLSDVLFVQVIRHHLESQAPTQTQGWLAGMRNQNIARALEAIHAHPAEAWTVASLAEQALLSRSTFASRFNTLVGESPLEYLTRWRMTLASDWLQEPKAKLLDIANRSGYLSEVAFHRAYKRITGRTPGTVKNHSK